MSFFKSLLAAAVIGLSAPMAHAISVTPGPSVPSLTSPAITETIFVDEQRSYVANAFGTSSQEFIFTAGEDLLVDGVSFTSNGTAQSVGTTSVAFNGDPAVNFVPNGAPLASIGFFTFPSFYMAQGDVFTFTLAGVNTNTNTLLTAYFETSIIPVPAALPLLGGGLLLLVGLRRRSKAA